MPNRRSGLNLIELIMSMVLMSLVLLAFFSIDLFSRNHVISSDRRAKVQNEISYAIGDMSKYVQQSIGDYNNPPIVRYPAAGAQTGFQVRLDLNNPRTPRDLLDDSWVIFYLNGNQLIRILPGYPNETLSSRVSGIFVANVMPDYPTEGFYVRIADQGMSVDVGLVGRYDPAATANSDNPQIAMKTRLVSPSSPAQ